MPNNKNKDQVKKLTDTLREAKSVAFVDYSGMNVAVQQELKNRLKEAGGTMLVAKNTLIKLAGNAAKLPKKALETSVLSNQTALILASDDPVSPIQALGKFAKEFELPAFKAGVVEGAFQNKEALETISNLPSKEVLAGQTVGAIGAPLYGLVGTLEGNLQKLIYILKEASPSEALAKGGEF